MAEKITFDARKYKRFNLTEHFPVRIKTSSVRLRPDKEIEGVVGNISTAGAMLVSSIFIPRESVVDIEISAFDSLSTSLKTNSRVVHAQSRITSSRRNKNEHLYCMGIEFLNLSDETRSIINEWIKKISENTTKGEE